MNDRSRQLIRLSGLRLIVDNVGKLIHHFHVHLFRKKRLGIALENAKLREGRESAAN